jgi:hypothetical protein
MQRINPTAETHTYATYCNPICLSKHHYHYHYNHHKIGITLEQYDKISDMQRIKPTSENQENEGTFHFFMYTHLHIYINIYTVV